MRSKYAALLLDEDGVKSGFWTMPAPINLLRPSLPFAFGKFAHHSTHGKPHSSMPLDATFRNKVSHAYGKGAWLHPHFANACWGSLKMMVIIFHACGSPAKIASLWECRISGFGLTDLAQP